MRVENGAIQMKIELQWNGCREPVKTSEGTGELHWFSYAIASIAVFFYVLVLMCD